jgi:cysteine synthase A
MVTSHGHMKIRSLLCPQKSSLRSVNKLSNCVGKTPLLKVSDRVWAKFEGCNPSGSIKDRMASYILNDAEQNGLLHKGDTIIEATSGNSGIAFAFLGAERGYKVKIVMPSNMSDERKQMLRFYGAELIEVGAGDFEAAISLRDQLSKQNGYFNTDQFANPQNIKAHYEGTAVEILHQHTSEIAAFLAGTGTGGTLMGCSRLLQQYHPNMRIVAVEPAESPVMSGGQPGLHGIQGIGDGSKFLVNLEEVNDVIVVSTQEAKERAIRLATESGLFVGISSGANVLAAEKLLKMYPDMKGNVITVLPDRGERYLSCF